MEVENEVVETEISTQADNIEGQESVETEEVNEEAAAAGETTEEAPEEEATDETEGDEAVETEEEAPVFKPNTKFKANDKEMDIPQEYHSLMKDQESEKAVRELFEKAHGLDSVKTKLTETRAERDQFKTENTGLKTSIGKVKTNYQAAVQSGNFHKLDAVWKQLAIPQEVIMQYAVAKAQLAEMEPAQRQMFLRQLEMENNAEVQLEQQHSLQESNDQKDLELRQIRFNESMNNQATQALAKEFDDKFGTPGAFQEEVINAGKMAFATENGKILSVPEAIQRVQQRFGLGKAIPQGQPAQGQQPAPASGAQQPNNPAAKKVVQRTNSTIPNVGGTNTTSPIKQNKPRSIADIEKLRDKAMRGEQV